MNTREHVLPGFSQGMLFGDYCLTLPGVFFILQAHCRQPEGSPAAGGSHRATFLPQTTAHPLGLPPSFRWYERLEVTWSRELDHIVVDLAHSRAFLIHFFPDNSALCSGPTKASREWGVCMGRNDRGICTANLNQIF